MIIEDDDQLERAGAATLLTGAILTALWAHLDLTNRMLAGYEVREVYEDAMRRLETHQAQVERDGPAVLAPVLTLAREQLEEALNGHPRRHVSH